MKTWRMVFKADSTEVILHDEKSVENLKKIFGVGWEAFWSVHVDDGSPRQQPAANPVKPVSIQGPVFPAKPAPLKSSPAMIPVHKAHPPAALTTSKQEIRKNTLGGPRQSTGKERRKHKRQDAHLKVIVVSGEKCVRSTTKDISIGGLMLQGSMPEEVRSESLRIYVDSPTGSSKIELPCRVVDIEGEGKRLEFYSLSAEQIKILEDWIQQSPRQAGSSIKDPKVA